MAETTTFSTQKFIGRVKWFNNKVGYGFVTVTDGEKSGSDIFVHHSSIKVGSEQYKYLVEGEYVEFTVSYNAGGKYEYQAGEVSGIKGGKLMCETRREVKNSRFHFRSSEEQEKPKVRGQGPRDVGEWTPVNNVSSPAETRKRGRPSKEVDVSSKATP